MADSDGADWEGFEAVDRYIDDLFVVEDEALRAAVARSKAAGLPEIQVSAGRNRGKTPGGGLNFSLYAGVGF
jgi:hypothetical protein